MREIMLRVIVEDNDFKEALRTMKGIEFENIAKYEISTHKVSWDEGDYDYV